MPKKKKKEIKEINYKKIFIVSILLVVVLSIILLLMNKDKNYTEVKLKDNNKAIFTIEDLTVGNLKFGSTEKEIEKELGKPKKETEEIKNSYKYKKISYEGISLLLRENYKDYMLVGVEVKDSKYKVGREIRVKDSIVKTMKKFKVDNEEGSYIYGNYSVNALNEKEIKENIYMGLRDKKMVSYINRDTIIENSNINVAKMELTYKKGKITKIVWSYDFE